MVVTGLLFVAVTAVIRAMGPTLPAPQAAFLRYAIGFALLGSSIFRLATHMPNGHVTGLLIWRGVMHALGVSLWFYAMARIPIAEVTAIGYITPILVTLGAALLFGEALKLRRVLGVVLAGFAGALIIIRPGFEAVSDADSSRSSARRPSSRAPTCSPSGSPITPRRRRSWRC